jgi:hypothetical protein
MSIIEMSCNSRRARDCAAARAPAIVKKARTRPSGKTGGFKYTPIRYLLAWKFNFGISGVGTRILIGKSMLILKAEACF